MTQQHAERWEFADHPSIAADGQDAVAELRRRIGAGGWRTGCTVRAGGSWRWSATASGRW
ncbi:hypothetical protein [Kitasatospora griseola]